MANLPETPVWETGIYQLEETDPVQGGPNGIDNQQGKQLANRTAWLKSQVETLGTGKQPLDATLSAIAALVGVADRIIYFNGPDTVAMTPLSAFIRTLLDDADASTARATLGAISQTQLDAALAAGFVFSGLPTGYIKFPSWLGSWIVQWGQVSVTSTATPTLPIAFTTSIYNALAVAYLNPSETPSASSLAMVEIGTMSLTSIKINCSTGSARSCWFLAIGK